MESSLSMLPPLDAAASLLFYSQSQYFLSSMFHFTISLLALLCFDLLPFPYSFSSPTMFSRSAPVITFCLLNNFFPAHFHLFISPAPSTFFHHLSSLSFWHKPINVFRPLLLKLAFSFCSSLSSASSSIAISSSSSRISYFQSQITVAGMPNSTRDTRGGILAGCHLTSNKKKKMK